MDKGPCSLINSARLIISSSTATLGETSNACNCFWTASKLGIKELLPPFLSRDLQLKDLLTGVAFACGGSGYDPLTSKLAVIYLYICLYFCFYFRIKKLYQYWSCYLLYCFWEWNCYVSWDMQINAEHLVEYRPT